MAAQVAVRAIEQTSCDDKNAGDKTGRHYDRNRDLLQAGAYTSISRRRAFFRTRGCREVAHRPLGGGTRRCSGGVRRHGGVGRRTLRIYQTLATFLIDGETYQRRTTSFLR